ncbi:hypothetical protein AB5I41_02075 [Sphingomonas sp. MMS24-JH45]
MPERDGCCRGPAAGPQVGAMDAAAPHPLTIPDFRAFRLAPRRHGGRQRAGDHYRLAGLRPGPRDDGHPRSGGDARHDRARRVLVPLFLLTPIVGLVADSVDRRWIVRCTTAVLVANAAVLGLLDLVAT